MAPKNWSRRGGGRGGNTIEIQMYFAKKGLEKLGKKRVRGRLGVKKMADMADIWDQFHAMSFKTFRGCVIDVRRIGNRQ